MKRRNLITICQRKQKSKKKKSRFSWNNKLRVQCSNVLILYVIFLYTVKRVNFTIYILKHYIHLLQKYGCSYASFNLLSHLTNISYVTLDHLY